jgi:glycosyltransferase involved in cell wall biosynthesis
MKILVISNCPLDPDQGSGYVINGFVSGMRLRGHEVDAYDPDCFILMPRINPARRLRLFIGYTFYAISKSWFGGKYDIIELWGGLGWLAVLILKIRRNRRYSIVSRSNGLEPLYREKCKIIHQKLDWRDKFAKFESWCDGLGFRAADGLTVVSASENDYAVQMRYTNLESLWQIDNPIPDGWRNQQVTHQSKEFTVGFVGSWLTRKGVDELKEIMMRLKVMNSNIRWLIAGVGKHGKSELEQIGVANIEIYERINREELHYLYKRMNVFMCLSTYESFGMVCSEAMACGCLLVATSVGFPAGLQDGKNYISVDTSDIQKIVEILCCLERSKDEYEEIRMSGYRRVQGLTWNTAIDQLESCYRKLISDRKRQANISARIL